MNNKGSFVLIGVILIVLGVSGLSMKDKVMCLGPLLGSSDGSCLLITGGDNIFNMKGEKISKEMGWAIQNLPPYVLGLGGIFIMGAVMQSNNSNNKN